jgi:hypothetical protein
VGAPSFITNFPSKFGRPDAYKMHNRSMMNREIRLVKITLFGAKRKCIICPEYLGNEVLDFMIDMMTH